MDMIEVTDKKETAADNTVHTIDAIDSLVQTNAMLQKRFKQKSNGASASPKKLARKFL